MASGIPPIVKSTLQAAILSATSNLLAQALTAFRIGKPFTLNPLPLFHFTLFTLLNTPPNVLWQDFLESQFPGYTLQPRTVKTSSATSSMPDVDSASPKESTELTEKKNEHEGVKEERLTEWTEEIRMERRLDKRNTSFKFLLDQTLGALVNTMVYLAAMEGLKGFGWAGAIAAVRKNTLSLMLAGYKLWPLVSLLQFTVVPVQQRVVVGSLVGVGWGVFLSLLAAH